MKLLYIINGLGFSNRTGIGGSDKRAIEIIRNLKSRDPKGTYDILTTQSGHDLFLNNEKLVTNYNVILQPGWWPDKLKNILLGRVLSYLYTFIAALTCTRKLGDYDLYFATSDFFFDVLPGYFYKKWHNKKLLCMIHHYIKDPFSREGSQLINILMFLSQRLSFWLIKRAADAIFFYETPEGEKLADRLFKAETKKPSIFFVKNGLDDSLINRVSSQKKIYDACFLGGLRYSKGIKEFVPIWKLVLKKHPEAKFLVIGGGSEEIVEELKKEVELAGLNDNIVFTGPLSGTELFTKIKQSRLFLFPSHEEGWGIALCEAMYCGLPVICYDLPAFQIFGSVLDKSNVGDYKALAEKTISYLDDPESITEKENQLIAIAKKYTWSSIAVEDQRMYAEIIGPSS